MVDSSRGIFFSVQFLIPNHHSRDGCNHMYLQPDIPFINMKKQRATFFSVVLDMNPMFPEALTQSAFSLLLAFYETLCDSPQPTPSVRRKYTRGGGLFFLAPAIITQWNTLASSPRARKKICYPWLYHLFICHCVLGFVFFPPSLGLPLSVFLVHLWGNASSFVLRDWGGRRRRVSAALR